MDAKLWALLLFLVLISVSGSAQEKSKKQIKEEQKKEKQKQTDSLLFAKDFVFVPGTALPQGGKTMNIAASSYSVIFKPEHIKSYMPFYGRAYSGVGYGSDEGMMFEGKPEEFTVSLGKKNYLVKAVVKGKSDTYILSLTVSFTGSASLTVTSNNRSSISYNGEIRACDKELKK